MKVFDQWLELTGITLKITGTNNSRATVALPDHRPGESTALKLYAQDGKKKTLKVTEVAPVTASSIDEAIEELFFKMRELQVENIKGKFSTPWTSRGTSNAGRATEPISR